MSYVIDQPICSGCHRCRVECPVGAIRFKNAKYWIDPEKCVSCGHCADVCHNEAISAPEAVSATVFHDPIELSCDVLVIGAGASRPFCSGAGSGSRKTSPCSGEK